jgi:uncharacterized sulfatase
MKRRTFLKDIAAGVTGCSAFPLLSRSLAQTKSGADRSGTTSANVLLINIEDLNAEAVGCFGNPLVKTPHLDRFAKQGLRFSRCYCQAPMCNPSRSSFLTGLRPETTRVLANPDPMDQRLPDGAVSLPELLARKNLHTINIGKLFHHTWTSRKQMGTFDRLEFCECPPGFQGQSTGLPRKMQDAISALPSPSFRYSADPALEKRMAELKKQRDDVWGRVEKGSPAYNRARAIFQQPMANIYGDSGLLEEQEADGKKARLAAHILRELAAEKQPFFVSLGFSKPHTPLRCPKKYLDLYDLMYIPAPAAPPEQDENIPTVARRFGRNYDIFNDRYDGPVTSKAAREAVLAYYACVSFIDAQIGLMLETLEETGLAENTIVLIFSDHGFQLGEHGLWSKYTLFEQSTRVPLLVRVPGLTPAGATCDEIVELVDLLPTLCKLLSMTPPASIEGTSFVPLLSDPRQPWKKAAFTTCAIAGYRGHSVRTKRWRYTDWESKKTGAHEFELYDLDTDPWEQHNLAQNPKYRNRRTILANLLQRGWRGARSPADATAVPVTRLMLSP